MRKASLSRKNFLKLGGLAVAGGFLAACTSEIEEATAPAGLPTATEEQTITATTLPTVTQTEVVYSNATFAHAYTDPYGDNHSYAHC